MRHLQFFFFFFNDTATTEIYTLSQHDALPISRGQLRGSIQACGHGQTAESRHQPQRRREDPSSDEQSHLAARQAGCRDRKSTRLNSSHSQISYAVFCLKKKNNINSVLHSAFFT